MNAMERNLLVEADRMSESMLVRLDDWQLAHLRLAMLHQVEEALNETLDVTETDGAHQLVEVVR